MNLQQLLDLTQNAQAANLVGAVMTNVIGDVAQHFHEQAQLAEDARALAAGEDPKKVSTWDDGSIEKMLLHALAGAIQAKVAGGDIGVGLASGALNEKLVPIMADFLKDQGVEEFVFNDKGERVKNPNFAGLMQLGSTLAGAAIGAVADDVSSASLAANVAKTATENNFLMHEQAKYFKDKYLSCKTDQCRDAVYKEMKTASDINIQNVEFYIAKGDSATVKKLEDQAASSNDLSFIDDPLQRRTIQTRQDNVNTLGSVYASNSLDDVARAKIISDLRKQVCGGMSASECDSLVNKIRVANDKNALSLVGSTLTLGFEIPAIPRVLNPSAAAVVTSATKNAVKGDDYKVSNLVYDATTGVVVDKYTGKLVSMAGRDLTSQIVINGNTYAIQKSVESSVTNPMSHYLGKYDLVLIPGYNDKK